MLGVNQVFIIGRLGKDPEGRSFPDGGMLTSMSIATSQKWSDKFGNQQEVTEWHRVIAYNRLADFCMMKLNKGKSVYIEGSLRHRQYQDNYGIIRYITEIEAKMVQPLE